MEVQLKEAWDHLHSRLKLSECNKSQNLDKWWQVLVSHYGFGEEGGDKDTPAAPGQGPVRAYHCLAHVAALMKLCSTHQAALQRRDLVELAIFFHDVVYDPKAKDNEEQSARLFERYATEVKLDPESKETVVKWIIDTKTHTTADTQSDSDEDYFLDFDLAILGENEERYNAYARQIRREYSHIPDEAYRTGRAQVLERFLQVPSLFRTAPFKLVEDRARSNVRKEIEFLRSMAPL